MNYEEIGNFIAKKRKEKKLTQKELAGKVGVTDKAVSKWERGLGCPDVSLLELISNELDISILELLKGKEIDISTNDIDSYVKDTINYSNNSYIDRIKKKISHVIVYIVGFISILLILLNISHFLYLNYNNKISNYEMNNEFISNSRILIEGVNKKINIIKKSNNKYSAEDKCYLYNSLDNIYYLFYTSPIIGLNNDSIIKINDLSLFDDYLVNFISIVQVYNVLSAYDINFKDKKNNYIANKSSLYVSMNSSIPSTYKYVLYDLGNTISYDDLAFRIYKYEKLLIDFDELLDDIMRVGGINE